MKKLLAIALSLFLATPAFAALVTIPGQGMWIPSYTDSGIPLKANFANAGQIISANASAKIVYMGSVYQPSNATGGCYSGTKNLQAFIFVTNNLTNGGTPGTVRFSVQGWSTSAGPPFQPDGSILGGGNAFSTAVINTMSSGVATQTPNFAASAAVSCGQQISLVFDWSSAGTGSTFQVAGVTSFLDGSSYGPGISTSTNGSTFTPSTPPPDVLLVFDDGTFGSLAGGIFFNNLQTRTYNSSSSPKEYGCSFTAPVNMTVAAGATMSALLPARQR